MQILNDPVGRASGTMTDTGGLPSHRDRTATERARLLRQIAAALDVPVTAFIRAPSDCPGEEPSSAECAAMLAAFTRIRDPKLREFALRMLESFAKHR